MTTTLLAVLTAAAPAPIPPAEAVVVEIVDGDTITVTISGVLETVRLIGIDAPEIDTCTDKSALAQMLDLLPPNASVTLTEGGDGEDRDHNGRLLRYVDFDGVDVGLRMIKVGHAIARYDSRNDYGLHDREDVYVTTDEGSPPQGCRPEASGSYNAYVARGGELREEFREERAEENGDVYYANCDAVREAGVDPIVVGDDGWRDGLDGDGDGVGASHEDHFPRPVRCRASDG